MVMVAFQSSYNQGVYGLVSNLGSLVVRTIFQVMHPRPTPASLKTWGCELLVAVFAVRVKQGCLWHEPVWHVTHDMAAHDDWAAWWLQPFEEAAFLAFSRSEPGLDARKAAAQRSRVLAISTRCVTIVGASSCLLSHTLPLAPSATSGLHACSLPWLCPTYFILLSPCFQR